MNSETTAIPETSQLPRGRLPRNKWLKLLSYGISALGLYLLAYGLGIVFEVVRTRHWQTTEGKVLQLEATEETPGVAEFAVDFEYRVNGKRYSGHWGNGWNHGRGVPSADNEDSPSNSFIAEFKETYAAGNPLTVHFDPANPADYYVDTLESPLIGSAVMILFGLILLLVRPRMLLDARSRPVIRSESIAAAMPARATEQATARDQQEEETRTADTVDQHDETSVANQFGATEWAPGKKVIFEKSAVSNSTLLKSGTACAAIGMLGVYIGLQNATQPWGTYDQIAAIVAVGSLAFVLSILILEGIWPAQKIVLDWKTQQVQRTLATRSQRWSFRDVQCIAQLGYQRGASAYVVVDGQAVRLFRALDFNFDKILELPFDQLPTMTGELAESLGVGVETELPSQASSRDFWFNIPDKTYGLAFAVLTTSGLLLSGWLPPLVATFLLMGLALCSASQLIFDQAHPLARSTDSIRASLARDAKSWLALAIIAVVGVWLMMNLSPIRAVGAGLAGVLLAAWTFVIFCTPDLVYSQRSGVRLPMFRVATWRLNGFPVRSFVQVVKIFRRRGLRCSTDDVAALFAHERVRDSDSLVAIMEERRKNGELRLQRMGKPDPIEESQANRMRNLRTPLTMLAGALAGTLVIGFFFVVTNGLQHADNLFIARQWDETEGTIAQKTRLGSRYSSAKYRFAYQVDEIGYEATCYGPRDLEVGSQQTVRFDRNNPGVACLIRGWRADNTPLFPMLFFAMALLIWLPLPILIGHLCACLGQAIPRRS